jgi:hypothetical protein
MATSPLQTADSRVRVKVREALALARGFGRTAKPLLEDINELLGGKYVGEDQLLRCLEWNLSKDYVRSEKDEDLDDELRWFITPTGKAKQNESIES